MVFLRDSGETEIGGFGITPTEDPLLVTDFCLVGQTCSSVSVKFDDDAVAEFFDRQVDRGLQPAQFARIWVHTHPGRSSEPSMTDEETFERVFGATDWAVMFILAHGGSRYCRLQFNAGPSGAIQIPVRIDFRHPFASSDSASWDTEYLANVTASSPFWLESDLLVGAGAPPDQRVPAVHSMLALPGENLDSSISEDYYCEFWT